MYAIVCSGRRVLGSPQLGWGISSMPFSFCVSERGLLMSDSLFNFSYVFISLCASDVATRAETLGPKVAYGANTHCIDKGYAFAIVRLAYISPTSMINRSTHDRILYLLCVT